MKKIISLLTVAIMAFVAMVAEAKTVTVTINDPEGASVIDTSISYQPITFTDGTATVTLGDTGGLQVSTNRGYDVTSITVNGTPIEGGNYISTDQMPDGCTVAIVVEKPKDKTVTVTIDNPEALNIINTSDGSSVSFSESDLSQTVTINGNSGLQVTAATGYQIATITVNGDVFPLDSSSNVYINASAVPDNCTINITTKEKKAFSFYIEGNTAQVSVIVNYDYANKLTSANSVDGRWTVTTYESSQTLTIETESGYVISSVQEVVTDGDNIDLLPDSDKYKSYANLQLSNVSEGTTIKIETATLTELRTAHVSVVLKNGTASQIQVRRAGETIPEADYGDITVIPGSENITITSTNYSSPLFKVAVGERTIEPYYGDYSVSNLQDGDEIDVWPDFPDEDFAVNITFTNSGTEGALSQLSVNGSNVPADEWSADGYTVHAGYKLGFTFDNSSFNITSVTVNGESQNSHGFEYVVTGVTNVVIDATQTKGREVTVIYTPGAIKIYNGNSTTDTPVTLPENEDEVTFEVSPSMNTILIEAEEGYIITKIEDADGEEYPSGSVYISKNNMKIVVTTEKFERNQTAVVYLQEDKQWEGAEIILSANNHSNMTEQTLKKGYNTVEYATQDRPFGFKILPVPDVYLNGEKIENNGGGVYEGTASFEPGDVIKIFETDYTVENYSLNISIASDVNVQILADYVTPIDGTSATVFGPTDVEFVAASRAASVPFIVKVNGTAVTPTEEGRVIATIDSNSTISVEPNNSTSITEINAENVDSAIYNLQGMRVSNPKKGIFIKNGKKMIL